MLILKKSCKALITALCTLFIYSCSSNDELDINSYQLQSIQWKLSADDAEKVDTIELPPKTTSNNTEEPMSITFSFEENIKETLSLIHISEPTRPVVTSRMPSSA